MILSDIPELSSLKAQLDGTLQFTEGLVAYTDGVAQLETGALKLEDGVSQLAVSASMIAASTDELYKAGAELNFAIGALYDGLTSYKEGTTGLKEETSGIDAQIKEKAEEMLIGMFGNGDAVVSFVSEKNINITSVQFILKTGAIEKPEEAVTEIRQPEKLSFWQKLLRLFKL
jgi:X-X-X-Leu-X-X-Gly heptad repeat protein